MLALAIDTVLVVLKIHLKEVLRTPPPPNVCALLVPWVGLQCDKLNPGGDTKLHKEVKTFLLLESFSSENPRKM